MCPRAVFAKVKCYQCYQEMRSKSKLTTEKRLTKSHKVEIIKEKSARAGVSEGEHARV